MSVELVLEDEEEDTALADALTAAVVNKEYGDRRFTGTQTISLGPLWPKAKVKCRIGYTLTKNDIKRRYTYAQNQCEGDYWVRAGHKTKITKARVTGKGKSTTSSKHKYVWSDTEYRIMTYSLNGNEYWGYTAVGYIQACPKKYYKNSVDVEQSFMAYLWERD